MLTALFCFYCVAPGVAGAELGCNTSDPSGRPAAFFAPGDRVVIEGHGFPSESIVSVGLVQGSIEQHLVTATTTVDGGFLTAPTVVPTRATEGEATIVVTGGYAKAMCGFDVLLVSDATSDSPSLAAWTVLLAVFGLGLVVVAWRMWRATRLEEAVSAAPVRIEVRSPVIEAVTEELPEEVPFLDTSDFAPVPSKSQTVSRLLAEARSWNER